MFCPGCAIQVMDDAKFCKTCGANLRGIREAMTGRSEQFDWSKTWVAEMFFTREEKERRRGVTPATKRNDEIKAGVITTLIGIGAMIFLRFFLEAVANDNGESDAEIIRRVWLIGVVPFLIGLGLLFNGIVLGKSAPQPQSQPTSTNPLPTNLPPQLAESSGIPVSVIEHTTAHLPKKREAIYAQHREEEP